MQKGVKQAQHDLQAAQHAQQAALQGRFAGLPEEKRMSALHAQEELKGLQEQLTSLLARETGAVLRCAVAISGDSRWFFLLNTSWILLGLWILYIVPCWIVLFSVSVCYSGKKNMKHDNNCSILQQQDSKD